MLIESQTSSELLNTYSADFHVIQLLLALDKHYIRLRRIKQLKMEAVKSNLAASKANQMIPAKQEITNENLKFVSKVINQNGNSLSNISDSIHGKFRFGI